MIHALSYCARVSRNSKSQLRRGGMIVILYILYTLGCWLAPLITLLYPFKKNGSYTRNVAETADKLVGAIYFGFSGDFTMSVEFAADPERFKRFYNMLKIVDPMHCELSLYKIHPYCRISDHKIGDR